MAALADQFGPFNVPASESPANEPLGEHCFCHSIAHVTIKVMTDCLVLVQAFGCNIAKNPDYPGTLFRFPLRTEAS